MRVPAPPARVGVTALSVGAAFLGLGSFGAPADPAAALSCPTDLRQVTRSTVGGQDSQAPRQQVLLSLPSSAIYTQVHMTGRLDEHPVRGGLTEVVVRGPRHEAIGVFRFAKSGRHWGLRYSAECGVADRDAARFADPFEHVDCPGYLELAIIDHGEGPVDHETPQQKARAHQRFESDEGAAGGYRPGFTATHATGPLETRYRFEGTQAAVIARDAYRRPIAVYRFDGTPWGWRMAGLTECSNYGPEPAPA